MYPVDLCSRDAEIASCTLTFTLPCKSPAGKIKERRYMAIILLCACVCARARVRARACVCVCVYIYIYIYIYNY